MKSTLDQIRALLAKCTDEQRKQIFLELRKDHTIHVLEEHLHTRAEIILEAMLKDEKGLTLRMIRGVIAEAAFGVEVLPKLTNWTSILVVGDRTYDYLLKDRKGEIRVQVKLQRSKENQPMTARQASRAFPEDMWVVETQKTRGGKNKTTANTRPYRMDDFDILAVSLYPSTKDWTRFMYAPARLLRPMPENPELMLKFQPVAKERDEVWTDDFEECVERLRG